MRTTKDGQAYGQEELDPLLWPSSKYLLTPPRYPEAVALVGEFLDQNGERLIHDTLKRALFFRDLWAVFDWLADAHAVDRRETVHLLAERRELRNRLGLVLRRLALSTEQIDALPDNYAAATAARVLPVKHDPDRSDVAFLPPELFQSDGPWVLLAEHGLTPAPQHLAFANGRSAFFVLMNLPDGRKATLAYLEQLRSFPNPIMPRPTDRSGRFIPRSGTFLNPDLPQFPAGTQFALVRQMTLIDDQGKIRPTKLIEMVQLRVFRKVPKREELPPEHRQFYGHQFPSGRLDHDFYEFRLRRTDLLAGKVGGLHAVRSDERVFSLFSVMDEDIFEVRPQDLVQWARDPGAAGQAVPATENLQKSNFACRACHNQGPGIHSVLSFRRDPPPNLRESSRRDQEQGAILWKRQQYSWGLLEGLTVQPSKK